MKDAIGSFLYGMCALGTCAAVIWLCSTVKSLCRKFLKRGEAHDGE